MSALIAEVNPLLWLLAFVPMVLVGHERAPESYTLLLVLSVLAIAPLATLLSPVTESVATKTGDLFLATVLIATTTAFLVTNGAARPGSWACSC